MPGIIPHFSADFKGLFRLESTSIIVKEECAAVGAAMERFAAMKPVTNLEDFAPLFEEGNSQPLDPIAPALTYLHEQDHLKLLSSTPVGLLLWRIEQCLSVDAYYLRQRLPDVAQGGHRTLLNAWVSTILASFGGSLDTWISTVAASFDESKPVDPLYETAMGALISQQFLSLLLKRSASTTIGQFLCVANVAFPYLARRSGLPPGKHPRWATRLSENLPLLRPDQPTLLEIVEASARARELTNLVGRRFSQPILDAWRESRIFDVYAPAFELLMSKLGSPVWSKNAIDLAVSTSIDISVGDEGEVLFVEDVLPSYRLEKIVSELRRRTWKINMADRSSSKELYSDLPRSIGLESIREMYEKYAKAELSLEANWGGGLFADTRGDSRITPEMQRALDQVRPFLTGEEHLKFVEAQYRRNFRLRVENPIHFITSQNETHEPILTFFSDQLVLCRTHVKNGVGLIFSAFNHFCDRELSRSSIYGGAQRNMESYEHLFVECCTKDGFNKRITTLLVRLTSESRSRPDRSLTPDEFREIVKSLPQLFGNSRMVDELQPKSVSRGHVDKE